MTDPLQLGVYRLVIKGGGSFRNGGTRIGESIVMEGGVGIEGGSRNGEGIVMEGGEGREHK